MVYMIMHGWLTHSLLGMIKIILPGWESKRKVGKLQKVLYLQGIGYTLMYISTKQEEFLIIILKRLSNTYTRGKELPKPDELDDFLSLDDGSIWEKMKRHKENPHCDAILNRNHYRMVYSTNQSQLEEDNIKFEKS